MIDTQHDYGGFSDVDTAPTNNLNTVLTQLADEMELAEAEVDALQEKLEQAKKKLKILAEERFPAAMDGLTGNVILTDGRTVQLASKVRTSVAKDRKEEVAKIIDEKAPALLKRRFIIEFNKGDEAWAQKFQRDLNQRKKKLNVAVERSVHPATLNSWVKEQFENGVKFNKELFGFHLQKFVKIK